MAKNTWGFIQKKYRQPRYYKEIGCNCNAVFFTKKGTEIMVEAQVYFLCSERWGADIDHYDILRQDSDCRRVIVRGIKTQKRAMELVEKYIENY